MNAIDIFGTRYLSPSSWVEMDLKQKIEAAKALFAVLITTKIGTDPETLYHERNRLSARLIRPFFKISKARFVVLSKFLPEEMAEVSVLNDFVFSDKPEIGVELTEFKHKGKKYFGPVAMLYTSRS